MSYYNREKTLRDILEDPSLTLAKRREIYGVKGSFDGVERHIDKVEIDGKVFTDYKAFSFIWEKSYVKEPVRSGSGTIGNLNSYATFLTPHLKIDFSVMSIDSYRAIMTLLYTKNEFIVTCYDIVNNCDTTNKMYFATEEMPKLYTIASALNGDEYAIELLGVQDYTVEMIGTNSSFDVVEILYYDNNGVLIAEANQEVDKGTEAIIDYNFVAPIGYRFDGEWKDKYGYTYKNGEAIRITSNLELYAQVVPTNEYTLSFSYGNGNELYSQSSGEVVNSVKVVKGQTISQAISNANIKLEDNSVFQFPSNGTGSKSVVVDEKTYTPYEFKGWYFTPEANENTQVFANTKFDYDLNRIIYQIYEPITYYITFQTNDENISFDKMGVKYGQLVPLPKPRKLGYTFVGWYTSSDFKDGTQFSGSMLPRSLTLYARWNKNE